MSNELSVDKRLVRRSFDGAAATYDAAAVLQREVSSRMLERLDYIKHEPRTILDAGSGTGFGSRALLRRYPATDVVSLDLAPGMLEAARRQTPWWKRSLPMLGAGREQYVCGDVEALPLAPSSVQMVWSNLTLQWCNDLKGAFDEIHRVLAPGGLFMFSTFGPDTLKELRQAFAGVDGYTHVNRFVDMHDIGDLLVQCGFSQPVMDMEFITLTYGDLMALLRELKAIGAHNVNLGRRGGLMGKRAWQALQANYEVFRREGRLPATYEVVYGHAWVGQKRAADGHQVIAMPISRRDKSVGD